MLDQPERRYETYDIVGREILGENYCHCYSPFEPLVTHKTCVLLCSTTLFLWKLRYDAFDIEERATVPYAARVTPACLP